MPLTANEFLEKYSAGSSRDMKEAFEKAIESRIDREHDAEMSASTFTVQMRQSLWKYGENGVLQNVSFDESDPETIMENMLQGTVYVLPDMGADGRIDFLKMHTLSATEREGRYYVQVMDAAEAKDAYENKPVDAPSFIDRLVDFFCRLVGKRDAVCALWDEVSKISGNAKAITDKGEQFNEKVKEKADNQNELLGRDYTRQAKNLSEEEKAQRLQQAQDLTKARVLDAGMEQFNEELTDWYLALYANSHDMFPTFISDGAEAEMTRLDQQALAFAEGKIDYGEAIINTQAKIKDNNTKDARRFWRQQELDGVHKGFDVRVNTVTTLAFALTADQNLSAEDVFKFLGGENVAGTEGLKEKMEAEMAKLNNPQTRNSPEMKALIKKGTDRMCTLLENQADLQSGISYQLGRTLQRNLVAFGNDSNKLDVVVDLQLSPVAKQIVKLQDDIISSYNADVLQGFALHSNIGLNKNADQNPEEKWEMGSQMTKFQAFGLLPINAQGQTNAAFLEKLSKQPAENRLQFLKGNMHVLQETNENLSNYVSQRAQEENCPWLKNPESLKAALNGGMVKEYYEAVMQSLRETGKIPVFENTIDKLMADDMDLDTWDDIAQKENNQGISLG